ncbi:MAG TPA: VOC family protein [Solirubrobacteraceae bacterium]|nr:VOC family protein [Solirubrobacteraceae bacterium]
MPAKPALIEFPADDAERARGFWSGLLGVALDPRESSQGDGWQSAATDARTATAVGVHARGRGPGDSFSLPYFEVDEIDATLAQVASLGGSVVHPGEQWAICKDSEGNPFGLARRTSAADSAPDATGRATDDLQTSRP